MSRDVSPKVDPAAVLEKEELTLEGMDISGHWNRMFEQRIIFDYDIDALATDLVMRREDLKRRLHDAYALSGLRVPQLKRILCHVRRKQGRTAVSPMRPHVCVCGPARLRANACE